MRAAAVLIPRHRPAVDRLGIDRRVFSSQFAIAVKAAAAVQGIAADLFGQTVGRAGSYFEVTFLPSGVVTVFSPVRVL